MSLVFIGNRRPRPSSWDTPAPTQMGIAVARFDAASGALQPLHHVAPELSAGATALSATRPVLYAVDETMTLPGRHRGGGGQVCAFQIGPSGMLREICRVPSHGTLPTFLAVDRRDEFLLVAHHTGHTPITRSVQDAQGRWQIELEYDAATLVLFKLESDGSVSEPCDVLTHSSAGGALAQQTHPQLHCVEQSPSGQVFVVCDKGSDELTLYKLDRAAGRLRRTLDAPLRTPAGSSPRHASFHPKAPFFLVNHETAPVLASYRYDECGHAECVHTLNIDDGLPAGSPVALQSDLRMHPAGHVCYDLVRGRNEVAVLTVDAGSGRIAWLQTLALASRGPRGCAVSPDGRHLLVASIVSAEIEVLAIAADGRLSATAQGLRQPSPGNVCFFEPGPAAAAQAQP